MIPNLLRLATALGIVACPLTLSASLDYVWWEAEHPTATNFPAADAHVFAPTRSNASVKPLLSGGAWLGIQTNETDRFIEYEVEVPATGEYHFYVRKFWEHGPFRWRFDEQPWSEVGTGLRFLDSVDLWEHVVVNWILAGKVTLEAGKRRLRIEITPPKPGKTYVAAFDAFVLTPRPFKPLGTLRPDESLEPLDSL